jgi:predicted site-specific integrase-resolvase
MTKSLQDTTKLKYAIYTRVSTNEQENENQLIKIKQYANKHKLFYDIYKEIESSSNNRPIKKIDLDIYIINKANRNAIT